MLFGVVATFAPCAAHADAFADAKNLFARGRELRGRGDCTSALPLFQQAYEIYPAGLGSLRNLAECQESLGHFASAHTAWLDLDRALQQNTEPRYAGWSQDAERGAARLASKLATLTVEVTGMTPGSASTSPDGVEVTLNGEPLSPSLLGTPLDRDPGRYLIRATGSAVGAAREQWVELSAGQVRRVIVDIAPTRAQATGASAADTARRATAWIAIGVGATGIVGAVISALVRQSAINELVHDGCSHENGTLDCGTLESSTVTPPADRGRVATTLVNVFAVVGTVGLASGLVLLATTPSRSATSAALVLSPSGVSAIGRF